MPSSERAPATVPVIAVDGPSGSGKGTLAVLLARQLGWHLLDSGALYRVTALAARRAHVPLADERQVAELAARMPLSFEHRPEFEQIIVLLSGENVSDLIRSDQVGQDASVVAQLPAVRAALMALQRDSRKPPGLVADGRDMGTVVFPDAVLKVFLDASPEERAQRRLKQLIQKGLDANLPQLVESIRSRDRRDRERAVSPLQPAADAVLIDSSSTDPLEIAARVLKLLERRGLTSP